MFERRTWLSIDDLKKEEWELQIELYGVQVALKDYLANVTPPLKNNVFETTYVLSIADEVNRYGNLIKRLNKKLADVREEIKEREDEDNITTAD